MSRHHLNYIILSDGRMNYLFERLGKKTPFGAYNKDHALCSGSTIEQVLENSPIPIWQVEKEPYEVIFNE